MSRTHRPPLRAQHRTQHRTALVVIGLAALAATASAQVAGTAQVSYVQPERFVDARDSWGSSEDTQKELSRHLQRLAERYLSDGQTLKVEVLDIDLAGRMRPFRSSATDVRVIKGNIDWPRITLRYVLEDRGQVLQRGEEAIADLNFTSAIAGRVTSEPLRYEKHMLDDWFRSRFVERQSAAAR